MVAPASATSVPRPQKVKSATCQPGRFSPLFSRFGTTSENRHPVPTTVGLQFIFGRGIITVLPGPTPRIAPPLLDVVDEVMNGLTLVNINPDGKIRALLGSGIKLAPVKVLGNRA